MFSMACTKAAMKSVTKFLPISILLTCSKSSGMRILVKTSCLSTIITCGHKLNSDVHGDEPAAKVNALIGYSRGSSIVCIEDEENNLGSIWSWYEHISILGAGPLVLLENLVDFDR